MKKEEHKEILEELEKLSFDGVYQKYEPMDIEDVKNILNRYVEK